MVTYGLSDKLTDCESRCSNIVRTLTVVRDKDIDRSEYQLVIMTARLADTRFQAHHRLTRFGLLDPKLESKRNHQIHQSTQDCLFGRLDNVCIDLHVQLGPSETAALAYRSQRGRYDPHHVRD